jgi:dihydroorotate dehydrogenase electron transfer subunit
MSSTGTAGLEGFVAVRPRELGVRPEPTWDTAIVVGREVVAERYYRLVLRSPSITRRATAGQFVMITLPQNGSEQILLPRPMAIHRRHQTDGTFEVIFNIVGRGTEALATVQVGDQLLVTGPLGRGFEIPPGASDVLLIGRGIGVCAVMGVAEDAALAGVTVTAVLSASRRSALLGIEDCRELGARAITVSDEEGTSDISELKAVLQAEYRGKAPDAIMVCGSGRLTRMTAELGAEWAVSAQVSLEAHMACGLGYCHGCAAPIDTRPTEEGPLVCLDGPVFDAVLPRGDLTVSEQ